MRDCVGEICSLCNPLGRLSDLDRLLSMFPEATNSRVPDCVMHQALRVRHLIMKRSCIPDDDFEDPAATPNRDFEGSTPESPQYRLILFHRQDEEALDQHQKMVIKMLMKRSHLTVEEKVNLALLQFVGPLSHSPFPGGARGGRQTSPETPQLSGGGDAAGGVLWLRRAG